MGQLRGLINEAIGPRLASPLRATVGEIRDLVKEEAEYVKAVEVVFGPRAEQVTLRAPKRAASNTTDLGHD